jgi:hypothetical protein
LVRPDGPPASRRLHPGDRPPGRLQVPDLPLTPSHHSFSHSLPRFAQKALNAANAGFSGLVILDDAKDTDTPLISGSHSKELNEFPVIFLLRVGAPIFP